MRSLRALIAVIAIVSTACAEDVPPPAAPPAPPPPPPPVATVEAPPPPPAPEKKLITVTTKSPDAKAAFLKGWDLYENNRSDEALALFKQAVAADPDFAFGHAMTGRLLTGAESQAELDKAVQLAGSLPEAERLYIDAYAALRRHDIPKAFEDFRRVAELAPDDSRAQLWPAIVRDFNRDFDGARTAYQHVLDVNPNAFFVYGHLAYNRAQARDYDASLAAARKYAEGAPNEPWAHQSVANALLNLGQAKEADAEMGKAIDLAPKSRSPYYDLAAIKTVERDYAGARDVLEKSKTAEAQPIHGLNRAVRTAWALLAEGKTADAFALLDATEKDADARKLPLPADVARTRAWALWVLGKPAEAIKAADAAMARCDRPEAAESYKSACPRDLLTVKAFAQVQTRKAADAQRTLAKLQENVKTWPGDGRGQATVDVLADQIAALGSKDAKVAKSAPAGAFAKCPPDEILLKLSVLRQMEAAGDKAGAEQARKDLLDRPRLDPAYALVARMTKK